jgi:hypothetical protein
MGFSQPPLQKINQGDHTKDMGINNGKNGNHQTEGYDEKGKTNYNLSSKESVLQQK